MRLYKSSEYAIRCLVAMASGTDDLYSAKRLSEQLDIPYKFLGRLMSKLGSEGIVEAMQGKNGGYRIAMSLDELRLADIIEAVEGLENYDRCILGFERCDDANPCPMHQFWTGPRQGVVDMIQDVTLAQMVVSGNRRI